MYWLFDEKNVNRCIHQRLISNFFDIISKKFFLFGGCFTQSIMKPKLRTSDLFASIKKLTKRRKVGRHKSFEN